MHRNEFLVMGHIFTCTYVFLNCVVWQACINEKLIFKKIQLIYSKGQTFKLQQTFVHPLFMPSSEGWKRTQCEKLVLVAMVT